MSEEEQSALFTIFQQTQKGMARKYGGCGLGLALSKRILSLMGGEIWVESEAGNGSCFSITVPLGIPQNGITAETSVHRPPGMEDADFFGKRILLVDDIDINLEIAVALLEPTRLTIDTVKNGKEAVDTFAAAPERYDAILMDVQMKVESLPEVNSVDLNLTFDPPWDKSMMSEEALLELGFM